MLHKSTGQKNKDVHNLPIIAPTHFCYHTNEVLPNQYDIFIDPYVLMTDEDGNDVNMRVASMRLTPTLVAHLIQALTFTLDRIDKETLEKKYGVYVDKEQG